MSWEWKERVDMSHFKGKVGQTFHLIGCPSGEKWGHLKKKKKGFPAQEYR